MGPGIVQVKFSAANLSWSSVVFDAFKTIVLRSIGLVITDQSLDGSRMSNAGTGAFVSFTWAVIVALAPFQPTLSVTVRFTLIRPGLGNVQFWTRPVRSTAPSPSRSQAYPESRIFPTLPG